MYPGKQLATRNYNRKCFSMKNRLQNTEVNSCEAGRRANRITLRGIARKIAAQISAKPHYSVVCSAEIAETHNRFTRWVSTNTRRRARVLPDFASGDTTAIAKK